MVTVTVALLAGVGVLVGISGDEKPVAVAEQPSDLDDVLTGFAAGLQPDGPYRPPTAGERKDIVTALKPLLSSGGVDRPRLADALRPLGFTLTFGFDPATARQYALVVNERGTDRAWGVYLVDLSEPVRFAVEVPHPNFDLGTERIGLALFRAVPGSVLLMAGAHRKADDGAGDVAHRGDSAFHAVATELSEKDVTQVQVHGFHDDSLPDNDVVVSPGAGKPGSKIRKVAEQIDDEGLATCRSWERACGRLEGTSNEQGKTAAEHGAVFVHLELSRSVRDDDKRWSKLVEAIADVVRE